MKKPARAGIISALAGLKNEITDLREKGPYLFHLDRHNQIRYAAEM
jgi:hypothetical protein